MRQQPCFNVSEEPFKSNIEEEHVSSEAIKYQSFHSTYFLDEHLYKVSKN
jgi:hypothetical protein